MKIDSGIVLAAADHVKEYLSTNLDKKFGFHDLSHTIDVVSAVEMITAAMELKKHEKNILLVAAWFHDVGYTERMEDHEDIGALHAENFLQKFLVNQDDIDKVKNCIIATHYPQQPLTEAEKILCDADMIHLADKKYFKKAAVLRKEWETTRNKFYPGSEWLELNIKFLTDHSWHTQFCKENFEERKKKNVLKLLALKQDQMPDVIIPGEVLIKETKKNKKDKEEDYGRGVDTLFKIASGNHMRLSGMADNKAHILLSINSIIISIVLSVLAKKLTEASYMILPTIVLLCVCLASMVFAVLTTRPKISKNKIKLDQVTNQEVNLLFFGNFHRMNPETYEWGIGEVMRDKNYLYKTLTKDVYYLGKVLAVKYRYLNIGYTIFMCGLITSVVTFAISFFLNHPA
ncbi:MAG: DUF5706 domain-containing protein [Ferruginibacter sp.]